MQDDETLTFSPVAHMHSESWAEWDGKWALNTKRVQPFGGVAWVQRREQIFIYS